MFKELKVIKLIVIVGLLVTILLKLDFTTLAIHQIYTDKPSYYLEDDVIFFAATHTPISINLDVDISNLNNDIVQTVSLNIESKKKSSAEKTLQDGVVGNNVSTTHLSEKINSGIYLIDNRYPLLVKNKEQADITVVYPYINNLINTAEDGTKVFAAKVNKTSLNRKSEVDIFTLGLKDFFTDISSSYRVNYITDIDLEEENNIKHSKLLIIYGKSTFWTPKMKLSLKSFIKGGGNVLLITSYALNNVCWYDDTKNSITLYDSNQSNAIESWQTYDGNKPIDLIGGSYIFGGVSSEKDYIIKDKTHMLFKGVDELFLTAPLYNSPPVVWNGNEPNIKIDSVPFYHAKILAYNVSTTSRKNKGVKGIFEIQADSTSGKIINLGTQNWCLAYQKDTNIRKVTLNAVNYLLDKSNK